MKLKTDIRGTVKSETLYGKAGDVVKVIRDCGGVILVEGPDGNRFPVKPDLLINDEAEVPECEKPAIADKTIKKSRSVPINQQELF